MGISIRSLHLPNVLTTSLYFSVPNGTLNPIDIWISDNYVTAFRNPSVPGYLHLGDVPSDQLVCTLQVTISLAPNGNPLYQLVMFATLPESSGVDVNYIMSPIIVLSRHEGEFGRPLWTTITPGMSVDLRQYRDAIAEIFVKLAPFQTRVQNNVLETSIFQWALAVGYMPSLTCLEITPNMTHNGLESSSSEGQEDV